MAYVIDKYCIACGACEEACPVGAVSYGEDNRYHINAEKCISCGWCMDKCSSYASISPDEETYAGLVEAGGKIVEIEIMPDKCIGCSLCRRVCPVGAIEGELKKTYVIDTEKCVLCGKCAAKCRKDAIRTVRTPLAF